MTLNITPGDDPPEAVLAVAEDWLLEAAQGIALTVQAVKRGEFPQIRDQEHQVKTLRAALQLYIDERNRVEKLRKQAAGAVGAAGLDFDAARAEIGRRLACLRDAG
ncbi:hypothetical protein [Frigidibacter oleivorans]|uniref:hypothetical protein n=1 Tax=Frigidibacter oleivorans TaxID=2487129 RepID=UPI000F8F8023|nr:hypothetical protein [Frigidibacter oleivorans]